MTASEGGYQVLDIGTGKKLWGRDAGWLYPEQAAFSPDGKHLLVTESRDNQSDHREVYLRDAATGAEVSRYLPGTVFNNVAFAPDGSRVLLATAGGVAASTQTLLIDPGSGKELANCTAGRGERSMFGPPSFPPTPDMC